LLIEWVQPSANRLGSKLLGQELAIAVVETHQAAADFARPSNRALFQPPGERQPRPYRVIVNWHSLVDVEPHDRADTESHDERITFR
jgi:hypothetical protein